MIDETISTALPRFFCIGAQKAGTTTLHHILARHARISLPEIKETKFFIDDALYQQGFDYYRKTFFNADATGKIEGEIDPDCLFFPSAAQRIYHYAPDSKLIVLLRDPIDRAYSHYLMSVRRGFEKLSFEDAMAAEAKRMQGDWIDQIHFSYIRRGFYSTQIRSFTDYFPRRNFLFLLFDELATDQQACIDKVCNFLQIDRLEMRGQPIKSNPATMPIFMWLSSVLHHRGLLKRVAKTVLSHDGMVAKAVRYVRTKNMVPVEKKPLGIETRCRLVELYREDIEAVSRMIEIDLNHCFRM